MTMSFVAGRDGGADQRTAGRATCARCATSSSARRRCADGPVITRADLVFGREMAPRVVSHDLAQAGARRRSARRLAASSSLPATASIALLGGLGFKEAKQSVVDAFEVAYLKQLIERNDGNITRSAQEAGLTRYHLRELLKRHGLTNVKE